MGQQPLENFVLFAKKGALPRPGKKKVFGVGTVFHG
jgi:hypothetical protein